MRKKYLIIFLFFSNFVIFGQEINLSEAIKALLDEALEIKIAARVYLPNQEPMICIENSTLTTIPGRSVAIKVQGGNLIINAVLTPYRTEDTNLILVAQGQVWLTDSSIANAVQYLSSFESIPINLGETILFFPLGLSEGIKNSEYLNIELAIQIVQFEE